MEVPAEVDVPAVVAGPADHLRQQEGGAGVHPLRHLGEQGEEGEGEEEKKEGKGGGGVDTWSNSPTLMSLRRFLLIFLTSSSVEGSRLSTWGEEGRRRGRGEEDEKH